MTLSDFRKLIIIFVILRKCSCEFDNLILVTPHARRSAFISFTSLFLSFMGGIFIITGYVTSIFTETGSMLSAKASSLLVSFTMLAANIIFLNIVDRFNRRVN